MRYIIGILIAMVALTGMTVALNPQPEPPIPAFNNMIENLGGHVVAVDTKTLVIDASNGDVDSIVASLVTLAQSNLLTHDNYVIQTHTTALTFAREKLKFTSKTTGDFNLAQRTKKTDHLGTYHFKNSQSKVTLVIKHVNSTESDLNNFGSSKPFSQSTSNIEDS